MHSDVSINSEDVVAGPYHHAFAEFVNAQMILDDILSMLKIKKIQRVKIPYKNISNFKGHHGRFFKRLEALSRRENFIFEFDMNVDKTEIICK